MNKYIENTVFAYLYILAIYTNKYIYMYLFNMFVYKDRLCTCWVSSRLKFIASRVGSSDKPIYKLIFT